eukprot:TRINITY_DN105559_c0_g1_i1.p1 TRINITY_DN105559_c0_g1~~TRINITY_DN105559_c0_g1_i1.p1  ORF type:complete len:487 (-),score=64.69 TRINITY_DN105559_c0_g1_i1:75-1535(-)
MAPSATASLVAALAAVACIRLVEAQPTAVSPQRGKSGETRSFTITCASGCTTTDKFLIIASASCTGNTGSTTASGTSSAAVALGTASGSAYTVSQVLPTTAGTYTACFYDDSATASTDLSIAITVSDSTPFFFSHLTPPFASALVDTAITLTSASATSAAPTPAPTIIFATSCSGATPATSLTQAATSHTVQTGASLSAATYYLCLRENGQSDSVAQYDSDDLVTALTLSVNNPSSGSDPVAKFGNTQRQFDLPLHTLVPLLHTPDMILHASVFPGNPTEQWFGRMVLTSVDDTRWMEIKIKEDLVNLNVSKVPRDQFATLDITMGYGSYANPTVTTEVPGFSAHVPYGFLGHDFVFRKMRRSHSIRNTNIGQFPRECIDMAGAWVHLYLCSAPAEEFSGPEREYALRYAHLDLAVIEVRNFDKLTGTLPELWGTQPMTEITRSYLKPGQAPAVQIHSAGTAWAGGPGMEELKKGCLEENETVMTV